MLDKCFQDCTDRPCKIKEMKFNVYQSDNCFADTQYLGQIWNKYKPMEFPQ